jgi:hypothetical protein
MVLLIITEFNVIFFLNPKIPSQKKKNNGHRRNAAGSGLQKRL